MKPLNFVLLFFGTVGLGTWDVLRRNEEEITRRAGRPIRVNWIATRTLDRAREGTRGVAGVNLTNDPVVVVRHPDDGAVEALAAAAGEGTALINAGDGRSAHPTQGLLDMLTLRQAKGTDFSRLKVVIVGDVKHSRVARSDLHALRTLGAGEIRVCGPASLLPDDGMLDGCVVGQDFDAMLEGVDAVSPPKSSSS